MKTLITGANGYIGKSLIQFMTEQNIQIVPATRKDFDYTDIDSIRCFFNNMSITKVIHLASVMDNQNTQGLFEINVLGLYNLLTVCCENKITHFTFASGNNVYGTKKDLPYEELDICEPDAKNLYGISKYVGELIIKEFCSNHKINYANVRIADIYGPQQKHGNLLKAIVGNAEEGKSLSLYGKGIRTRDYIYISDVVQGLMFISQNELQGEYNLATGVGTDVKHLLTLVNDILDQKLKIENIDVENEDESNVVLNPSKLANSGYSASINVTEGLKKIIKGE